MTFRFLDMEPIRSLCLLRERKSLIQLDLGVHLLANQL